MKNKLTGILSFLLALMLVLGTIIIMPVSASAENEDEQDYSYFGLYLPDEYGNLAYDSETGIPLEMYQLNMGESPEGVIYDAASRTVTLDNFRRSDLMLTIHAEKAEKYTVVVTGECELAGIGFTSGPVPRFAIEGNGVLTLNKGKQFAQAIRLYANDYLADGEKKASLAFGRDVKLRLYGANSIINALTMEKDSPFIAQNGDELTCETEESIEEKNVYFDGYISNPYTDYLGNLVVSEEDPDGTYVCYEDYDQENDIWSSFIKKVAYSEELDAYLYDASFKDIPVDGDLPDGYSYAREENGRMIDLYTLPLTEQTYTKVKTAEGEEYLVVDDDVDFSDIFSMTCTAYTFTELSIVGNGGYPYAIITGSEEMTFVGCQDEDNEPAEALGLYNGVEVDNSRLSVGFQAESYDDPDGIYTYSHYYYEGNDSEDLTEIYEVSRWLYEEPHSHYFRDDSFEPVELTPEEFDSAYSIVYEGDDKMPKELINTEIFKPLYNAYQFTDGEDNYACTLWWDDCDSSGHISEIYQYEALDGIMDDYGNQMYYFIPTELDDVSNLTQVKEEVKTGAYEHVVKGEELLYNISGEEIIIDTLDIGNLWTFNLISSNPKCEPCFIPFTGEVNPDIEGAYMDDEIWTNTVDGSASSKSHPAALKPGYAYDYTAVIKANVGYRFSEKLAFTYLGEPAENAVLTLSEDGSTLTITGLEKVTFLLDQPVIKSAAVAYGGVNVTWDAVKGASKYRVFRKQAGKGWTKLADTAALTYTDKSAVSGTTYNYTVRCISDDGKVYESAYDTVGKSVTYVAAPVISKFENVNSGTKITWKAVKGAKYYRVFVKNGSSWKALGDTAATSYTATKRTSGTKYTYTVRAMDANKKFVSAFNTTGWGYTFIAAPAVPKLTSTKNGVQITYTKSKGGPYFRIFRKQAGKGWSKLADTSAVKYVDKTAKKGVRYSYTVRCISKDGKKYYSGYNVKGSTIVCKR